MEDPSLGAAVDPSLGLTDGGLLVWGLSSQGSLDVIVVERAVFIDGGRWVDSPISLRSGMFASEEAEGE